MKFYFFVLFLCLSAFSFPLTSFAQVRLIQWSDAHSTLNTKSKQIQAIDLLAQDFYSRNPRGEFVVYVIGDYTSINPYNQKDGGQWSFDALKILKEKGYTVLFTPGNHDAFDWVGKMNGADLFLKQMRELHRSGIPILASNLIGTSRSLNRLLIPSYTLTTLNRSTAVVGLTIEVLFGKSNLTEETSTNLFKGIETYELSLKRTLNELSQQGHLQAILGIHHGHRRMSQLAESLPKIQEGSPLRLQVPLVMAADDHLVASYKVKGSLITDAGSHGSFNVIDIDRSGHITKPILHVGISRESLSTIKESDFIFGRSTLNPIGEHSLKKDPVIYDFHNRLKNYIETTDLTLQRPLVKTTGIETHKYHMKLGRTDLGSALSQSLVLWVKNQPWYNGSEQVISMVNSSSYRIERAIPAGEISEMMFREMYPFLNDTAVYRLTGEQIKELFFSLRTHYAEGGSRYSPQLPFHVREQDKDLQILIHNEWTKLKNKKQYLVVFDGWLSEHRFGQSFRIKEWLRILSSQQPLANQTFQEILVEYMPKAIEQMEKTKALTDFLPAFKTRRIPMPVEASVTMPMCRSYLN